MQRRHTPFAVPLLATTLFIVTTSEFQVADLLVSMSRDLHVAPGRLGFLVTTYSLAMGLGGPVVALALRRVPARAALPVVLGVYAAAEVLAGLSTDLLVLAAMRAVTGAMSGAVFGMALAGAMALGDVADRGRHTATVLLGLIRGSLLGLPLSRLLGEALGWRASFFALGGAAALAGLVVAYSLPALRSAGEESVELAPFTDPRLWMRYLVSFLTIGGAFAAFAFIDPLLAHGGVKGAGAVTVMVLFGLAAFVTNTLGGRVAPGRARPWLIGALSAQVAALVALWKLTDIGGVSVSALIVIGGTGMSLSPLLINRVMEVAPPSALVNTVHTAAITMGVAVATAAGGAAMLADSSSVSGPAGVGATITVAALVLTLATRQQARTGHEGGHHSRPLH